MPKAFGVCPTLFRTHHSFTNDGYFVANFLIWKIEMIKSAIKDKTDHLKANHFFALLTTSPGVLLVVSRIIITGAAPMIDFVHIVILLGIRLAKEKMFFSDSWWICRCDNVLATSPTFSIYNWSHNSSRGLLLDLNIVKYSSSEREGLCVIETLKPLNHTQAMKWHEDWFKRLRTSVTMI